MFGLFTSSTSLSPPMSAALALSPPTEGKTEAKPVALLERKKFINYANAMRGIGKSDLPPPLQLAKKRSRTLRYTNSSSSLTAVTAANVACAFGTICTVVNSTVKSWVSSFRIDTIRVWPSSGGSAYLLWGQETSGLVPDDLINRSIPTGITVTGSVTFTPTGKSLASMWRNATDASDTLFYISSSVGSVCDVQITETEASGLGGFTGSVVAGVVGNYYYLALDGPSSNNYKPVDLPTTA